MTPFISGHGVCKLEVLERHSFAFHYILTTTTTILLLPILLLLLLLLLLMLLLHIHFLAKRYAACMQIFIMSCLEAFTADHKPLMGESPEVRGFFLGCGFNSSGMMLSKSNRTTIIN